MKLYLEIINEVDTFLLFHVGNDVLCIEPDGKVLQTGPDYIDRYKLNIEEL